MITPSTTPSGLIQPYSQQAPSAPSPGVSIEIRPGENNVDTGDRSQNTLEVEVTTANRQAATEVSREQILGFTENRLQQRALESVTGNPRSNATAVGILAVQSGAVSSSDINQVATAHNQQQAAQAYLDAASGSSAPGLQANPGPSTDPVQLANTAVDAYVRQTLLFSETAQQSPAVDLFA